MGVKETTATQVRADGRVTLPAAIRKELEIEPGDSVILTVQPVGGIADD